MVCPRRCRDLRPPDRHPRIRGHHVPLAGAVDADSTHETSGSPVCTSDIDFNTEIRAGARAWSLRSSGMKRVLHASEPLRS